MNDSDEKKKDNENETDNDENWKACHYVGKKDYMAPEVRQLRKYHSRYKGTTSVPKNERYDARAADMWCVGIVLFRACFWLKRLWGVDEGNIIPRSRQVYDYVVNRGKLLKVVKEMPTENLDLSNWKEMELAVGMYY